MVYIKMYFNYLDAVRNLTYTTSDEKLYNLYSICLYDITLDIVTLINNSIFNRNLINCTLKKNIFDTNEISKLLIWMRT